MDYKLKSGQTLSVREVTKNDAKQVLAYMHIVTKETNNLLREPSEFSLTLEQEKEFINKVIKSPHECMVLGFIDGELVTTAGIHGSGLNRIKHRVSLGISVLKKYHHQGIGTIIMEYLIQKARELGKSKIELDVRADNPNAIKLYKKLGFDVEGIRKDGINDQGTFVDLVQMGLFIGE